MSKFDCFLRFLGRVFIAAIFLFGASGKIFSYDVMAGYMASKGLQYIPFLLVTAAIIELVCGIALVIGYKAKLAAAILFLYLIPVTYFMHDFWNLEGAQRMQELVHFFSNLAIEGGLLLIASSYPEKCSTESCR